MMWRELDHCILLLLTVIKRQKNHSLKYQLMVSYSFSSIVCILQCCTDNDVEGVGSLHTITIDCDKTTEKSLSEVSTNG